ncbi:LOW QUALITY PROTEIN: hypothetical protein PHMEG_00013835 [Phytophthora megakarya]|uniref:Jacalin-type lectin domain-containing protein n=1 Tax=Phytophthora megakarya TaxID=4795 RepID=A0A225W5S8_9STRA|nr:LOW QUALITY PROTEIN: hypothetical protein PHMEG_00013835 [Phytophthora megakarya]
MQHLKKEEEVVGDMVAEVTAVEDTVVEEDTSVVAQVMGMVVEDTVVVEQVELGAASLAHETIDLYPEGTVLEVMMRKKLQHCPMVHTSNFGGPHGYGFSDEKMVKSGQKVLSINLRTGERVDGVILTIVSPTGEEATLVHGGSGGDLKTPLALAEGEYITFMEAHTGKHKDHTRIKYIKFTTSKGNFIEGGTKTDKIGTDTAKEGYQLSGFVGRSGDELDLVGAIWTSIQPVA